MKRGEIRESTKFDGRRIDRTRWGSWCPIVWVRHLYNSGAMTSAQLPPWCTSAFGGSATTSSVERTWAWTAACRDTCHRRPRTGNRHPDRIGIDDGPSWMMRRSYGGRSGTGPKRPTWRTSAIRGRVVCGCSLGLALAVAGGGRFGSGSSGWTSWLLLNGSRTKLPNYQ
jgi:hypothetical protein